MLGVVLGDIEILYIIIIDYCELNIGIEGHEQRGWDRAWVHPKGSRMGHFSLHELAGN